MLSSNPSLQSAWRLQKSHCTSTNRHVGSRWCFNPRAARRKDWAEALVAMVGPRVNTHSRRSFQPVTSDDRYHDHRSITLSYKIASLPSSSNPLTLKSEIPLPSLGASIVTTPFILKDKLAESRVPLLHRLTKAATVLCPAAGHRSQPHRTQNQSNMDMDYNMEMEDTQNSAPDAPSMAEAKLAPPARRPDTQSVTKRYLFPSPLPKT